MVVRCRPAARPGRFAAPAASAPGCSLTARPTS